MGTEEQHNSGAQEPQSNGEGSEMSTLDEILSSGEDREEEEFEDQEDEEDFDDEGYEEEEDEDDDDDDDEDGEEDDDQYEEEEEDDEDDEDEDEDDDEDDDEDGEDEVNLPEWTKNVREAFPDREFNSMEDFDRANTELHQHKDEQISQYQESESQLLEIFNQNPQMTQITKFLAKGYSVRAALVKAGFTPEDFQIEEGDEDAEQLVEAKLKRKEAIRQEQERQATLKANEEASNQVLQSFKERKGIKDSVFKEFSGRIVKHIDNFINMQVTDDDLEMYWKSWKYDEDLKNAEDRGRIQGRNDKITIQKKKKNGDGVPRLKSSQAKKESKKEPQYEDDWTKMMDGVLKDA